MKEEIRRAIIAVVVKKTTGKNISSVYCYETGRHTKMTGAYDYDVNAAFTENYHYGTGTNFQISLNQNSFTGYDSESGSSFSGSFEGSNLTIFVGGKRYNYSI